MKGRIGYHEQALHHAVVLAESGGHGSSPSLGNEPSSIEECIGLLERLLSHSNTDPSALLAPDVPNDDPPIDIISKYDATLDAELVPLERELAAERGARWRRRRGRGLHWGPLSRI